MIILKPGQAADWIAAARASGQPLVIIVGERVEGYSVHSGTAERVAEIVREAEG